MNFINIIQNPFILNAYFSKDYFYSFETDNQLKREELFNLLSRIYYLSKENTFFRYRKQWELIIKRYSYKIAYQKYNS